MSKTNESARYYVGVSLTSRIVFKTAQEPTLDNPQGYQYVIGPFRTKGAALLMARYGQGNPHMQHVNDCERFNRQLPAKWNRMAGMQPNQHLNGMEVQHVS